jgi:hypothetical protein
MNTVELEVEKIRAVRREIAERFNFDPVRLGDHYRERQAAAQTGSSSRREASAPASTVKEEPHG